MSDRLSVTARSALMRSIRSVDTKPEKHVRSVLHRLGYRFRLHRNDLPGKPDIVLPKHRAVIFVNGCFWHSHTCKAGHCPKSRQEYWGPKLKRTVERDAQNYATLRQLGWRVKIIWECELSDTPLLVAGLLKFIDDA